MLEEIDFEQNVGEMLARARRVPDLDDGEDPYEPIRSAKARRETVRRSPPVVHWDPDSEKIEDHPFRPPAGTVMLFWGASGTDLIDELETAVVREDPEGFATVAERILENEELMSRDIPNVAEGVEKALEAPAIFDFSYGSRELGRNLALRDVPLGTLTFPYTGGELDPQEFNILECPCGPDCPPEWPEDFPWPGPEPDPFPPDGPYDYLVVVSPPEMSEVERRATETIPPDVREANVLPTGSSMQAAAVVAVALAVVAVTISSSSPGLHEDLREVTLPDRMVGRLGSRAAVGELLDMRREVLHEYGFA